MKRYRILKDTPLIKAGTIFEERCNARLYVTEDHAGVYEAYVVENSPEWFALVQNTNELPSTLFLGSWASCKGFKEAYEQLLPEKYKSKKPGDIVQQDGKRYQLNAPALGPGPFTASLSDLGVEWPMMYFNHASGKLEPLLIAVPIGGKDE